MHVFLLNHIVKDTEEGLGEQCGPLSSCMLPQARNIPEGIQSFSEVSWQLQGHGLCPL